MVYDTLLYNMTGCHTVAKFLKVYCSLIKLPVFMGPTLSSWCTKICNFGENWLICFNFYTHHFFCQFISKFCHRVWELIMYTHSIALVYISMTSTIVIFIKNKCNFLPSLPGAIKSQSLKEAAPVVPQKSIFHPIPQNLALIYRTIQRREEVGFWCGWFCLGLVRVLIAITMYMMHHTSIKIIWNLYKHIAFWKEMDSPSPE